MSGSKKRSSSLHEKAGISPPEITNISAIQQIKKNRRQQPSSKELIDGILTGNITALSRAITLVESTNPEHTAKANEVIKGCLPHANQSIRIGITGVPGVGKSTFIEAFGTYLTQTGKKVAVLAVDPSSSISHGSILGDKTRMEELVKDKRAFIRPSASGDTLGGVARKTRESIILCEACGFDTIIIETVGVGQRTSGTGCQTGCWLDYRIPTRTTIGRALAKHTCASQRVETTERQLCQAFWLAIHHRRARATRLGAVTRIHLGRTASPHVAFTRCRIP